MEPQGPTGWQTLLLVGVAGICKYSWSVQVVTGAHTRSAVMVGAVISNVSPTTQ
jgi:hypothetical protein